MRSPASSPTRVWASSRHLKISSLQRRSSTASPPINLSRSPRCQLTRNIGSLCSSRGTRSRQSNPDTRLRHRSQGTRSRPSRCRRRGTGYAYPQQDYAQQQYYAQPTQPVPAAAPAPGYGAPYNAAPGNYAPYPVKPKMNTMAVVGFIFSFLISIVGLILCIIAKNQIKTRGGRGDGLATAGIIISIASMVLAVILRMSMGSSSDTYSSTVLLPMLFGFLG